ncbi:MAG: coenzyme F420-0:L-glutamate ligase [Clostridia bacterium]|nr:coenzyme F420-0:L-glutamate ligase [Clostridiales bacterium]MDD7166329.1 coenzyme F420-0:L-glutamate ligase [Clostridia bacterium]MDY2901367.1 coenzyme F420-0:L-glutamate ligase [Christensenellaceae bacterium]
MDYQGTISRGVRAPIIRRGDDLVKITADCVTEAAKQGGFEIQDKDVIAVTEAVLARAQGNYATIDQIAKDVSEKFGDHTVGLVLPIFSRNRFSMVLKGISKGVKKLIVQLSYPSDEVGNSFVTPEQIYEKGVNPYSDVFTAGEFRKTFGDVRHIFTGVDYIDYYEKTGNCEVILANDPCEILKHTKYVINADIHTRKRTKARLLRAGAEKVVSLDEILTAPVDGSGYNADYGVLGSNLATENSVKLFPRDGQAFVDALQAEMKKRTGKHVECMVYGDGAFKDPVGGIWELADPVCSPAFTSGLDGKPNEIKLKYLADNDLASLSGDAAIEAMKDMIKHKESDLTNNMKSQGTTPRRITDLLASLSDLTSGSGDKGTPFILIQNYFKNYSM